MFYLITHSKNVLIVIYWTYGKRPPSERGNLLPALHELLFQISSKGSFIMHHPTDRILHTTIFVTPAVEHLLKRETYKNELF